MHHWRTGGLDIPCQVASPQSLTPFLQTISRYRFRRECFNRQSKQTGDETRLLGKLIALASVKQGPLWAWFSLSPTVDLGVGLPTNRDVGVIETSRVPQDGRTTNS